MTFKRKPVEDNEVTNLRLTKTEICEYTIFSHESHRAKGLLDSNLRHGRQIDMGIMRHGDATEKSSHDP